VSPSKKTLFQVDVQNTTSARISRAAVRRTVQGTLEAESVVGPLQIGVLFCGEQKMRSLNSRYRNRDYPTDVLAFAQDECAPGGMRILGDVVVCVPVARRQARQYGHSLWAELALLTVHGVLHLLGYEDGRKEDKEEMQARQEEILSQLGVG